MTMQSGLALALILFIGGALWLQARMARSASKDAGKPLPEDVDPSILDAISREGRAMLYFYSPVCLPCRAMSPKIRRLADEASNVFVIDVSRSLDEARRFGIRATPTTLMLAQGRIEDIALGALSERHLRNMLGGAKS